MQMLTESENVYNELLFKTLSDYLKSRNLILFNVSFLVLSLNNPRAIKNDFTKYM